jgi:hypothetical protein
MAWRIGMGMHVGLIAVLNDGETTDAQGKPLTEEANIDIENYYRSYDGSDD